jgi:hypothetical protein
MTQGKVHCMALVNMEMNLTFPSREGNVLTEWLSAFEDGLYYNISIVTYNFCC